MKYNNHKKVFIFIILFFLYFLIGNLCSAAEQATLGSFDAIFYAIEGGKVPSCQSFTIVDQQHSWNIVEDATWLSIFPTSGSTPSEGIFFPNVNACVSITDLEAGYYETTITFTNQSDQSEVLGTGSVSLFISNVDVRISNNERTPVHFEDPIIFKVTKNIIDHLVGDFNNDGNSDIAVLDNNGKFKSILNSGRFPYFESKKRFGFMTLFLGNGKGKFKKIKKYKTGVNPYNMVSGDFNGDTIPDIAVSNAGIFKFLEYDQEGGETGKMISNNISIFYGKLKNGEISFSKKKIKSVNAIVEMASFDFNLDEKDDLLIFEDINKSVQFPSDFNPNFRRIFNLAIFRANKKGFIRDINLQEGYGSSRYVSASTSHRISKGIGLIGDDFDDDGDIDLIASKATNIMPFQTDLFLLKNKGDGTFVEQQIDMNDLRLRPLMVTSGDFNNDKIPDIITLGGEDGGIGLGTLNIGNGDGTFSFSVASNFLSGCGIDSYYNANMKMLAVDLDSDNNLDFIFPRYDDPYDFEENTSCNELHKTIGKGNRITVLFGYGDGNFFTRKISAFNKKIFKRKPMKAIVGGDFNKDGKVDLAITEYKSKKIKILIQK